MNLTKELLLQIADPTLTYDERARRRCQLAKQLEELGSYERARDAVGELWQRVGERPVLNGLDQRTAAEVLLRAGTLTGWLGSAKQIEGAQEKAKNLISESMTLFETLQDQEKVAEAQTDLAYCYWREGALDEARVLLQEALSRVGSTNSEVKAIALIRSAIVERSAKRFNDALRIHKEAAPVFEKCDSHVLRAKFHIGFANVLHYLSTAEYREDYVDRAFIEYTAAGFHFEQAGHTRYQAYVENNLGFLLSTVGKFSEAHEHLDRAQALFTTLKDTGHLAQVDDTRAKVLLAEGRVAEAEKLARAAVRTLERGGEQSLLAEALTTHGIALARLGRHQHAHLTLQRTVVIAEQAGDLESAGQAALTVIEELGLHLPVQDLSAIYGRAAELLAASQNLTTLKRLAACAQRVLFLAHAIPTPLDWTGFSFKATVRRYEARLIERALKDADGMVSRAAQLLGFSHQSLISMLANRHKNLLPARTPVAPRRRSILRPHSSQPTLRPRMKTAARPITILHVEDNELVAATVADTLALEGWTVARCATGHAALQMLASSARYDLLLLDNEVPGANGLELVRYARELVLHRRTPIIMLSASDCAAEARRAGVDAFLRKPEDVPILVETISRLLIDQLSGFATSS